MLNLPSSLDAACAKHGDQWHRFFDTFVTPLKESDVVVSKNVQEYTRVHKSICSPPYITYIFFAVLIYICTVHQDCNIM